MPADDAQLTVIEKLEKIIEGEEHPVFSKEEHEVLQSVARVILGLKAFGAAGEIIRSVIGWVGLIVALVIAAKAGVLDFLAHLVVGSTP